MHWNNTVEFLLLEDMYGTGIYMVPAWPNITLRRMARRFNDSSIGVIGGVGPTLHLLLPRAATLGARGSLCQTVVERPGGGGVDNTSSAGVACCLDRRLR